MDRNYEFDLENNKLNQVLKLLNIEMLDYITKRKYITEYIIEYRKKEMEENKHDEDETIKYFDHEAYVKEEAYKIIDKRLKEISVLKESPYFGKISFEEDEDFHEMYIGRFGVTKQNGYEPVIIDWRAPVASLFYKGTLGKCSYNTPDGPIDANILGRRQLVIKKGQLKGIFDSALDVKDEILQMVLSQNTSKNLKDIVMTIQKEQDEIIRANEKKIVVVNGVAGSGKTTIALHRVSYLLYNFRKKFGDKILILGPNEIFMDYISEVLPSLGESNVFEQTFETFATNEININDDNIKKLSFYIEESLKGNEKVKSEYMYKNSLQFLNLLDSKVKELNQNYFKFEQIKFFGDVIVDVSEISELFNKYYINMPLFRRSEKIKRILTSKIKDKRDELVRNLNKEIKEKRESLSSDEYEIQKNDMEFKRRIRIREIVREVINARKRLDQWIKSPDMVELYKEITNTKEIGYIDLAGILYIMIKLQGKKCKREIKHIVIDEAQDYSMIQFIVLKELTSCSSFTIVGDKNQRFIKAEEIPSMLKLSQIFDENQIVSYELSKSYRSTKQIMDYASSFLDDKKSVPLVRDGENVLEEETEDNDDMIQTILSLIEDYEEEGLESIAVIVQNDEVLKKVAELLKGKIKILTFDREDIIYNGGRVLIPCYYAKGLEFDGVIIVEEKGKKIDPLVKYIMCTRALHRLSVIK